MTLLKFFIRKNKSAITLDLPVGVTKETPQWGGTIDVQYLCPGD